ncbi:hypothetical protein PoB_000408700 [Plakobranchus ocellatus]|uniref:Uncharacterized protein n=1 Tax=Plakobranchus ocellatus TaxID=259542 RepID=A0AAV3Y4D5_9GAST|nr:hypothetical protein PoB_000408700 [Plakobranchus ocellatus]
MVISGELTKRGHLLPEVHNWQGLPESTRDELECGNWANLLHRASVAIRLDLLKESEQRNLIGLVCSLCIQYLQPDEPDGAREMLDMMRNRMTIHRYKKRKTSNRKSPKKNNNNNKKRPSPMRTVIALSFSCLHARPLSSPPYFSANQRPFCLTLAVNTVVLLIKTLQTSQISSMTLLPGAQNVSQSACTSISASILGPYTTGKLIIAPLRTEVPHDPSQPPSWGPTQQVSSSSPSGD